MPMTIAVLVLGGWILLPAQEKRSAEEYEVKSAFLNNFAKFVEWSAPAKPAAGTPIRFGIAGTDPSSGALEKSLSGKIAQGCPITVEFFDQPERASSYHVVFVPSTARDLEAQILAAAQGKPVLTVGEREGFIGAGGLFNFYLEEKKVRLEVNNEAASKAGLTVSSKLLRVARIVK
jgi:hypothetical protein